jgi:uncharacterized protein
MTRKSSPASDRVRVKRLHERGAYDRASIDAILDAGPLAHVGYTLNGAPFVTPTLQWREGDHVYWHGSAASRMLDSVDGADVCLSVTIIDGMVLARSAFHHSVNYRSVMLLGRARKVTDQEEKRRLLLSFTESLFPGRWSLLRPVKVLELKATNLLTLPISEASAKIRKGPPIEDQDDHALDVWAGVIPIRWQVLPPNADEHVRQGVAPPVHVTAFHIGGK